MRETMDYILWLIYWTAIAITSMYCLYVFVLTVFKLLVKKVQIKNDTIDPLPLVTIQLPLYNEPLVAEALFQSIDRLDYPASHMEIQILDDSTDETLQISKRWKDQWIHDGKNASLLHRTKRKGFKAGALAEGMAASKGEFIAIFDADFRPPPHFLQSVLSAFHNEKVAVVQTRWGFSNSNQNLLTRLQVLQLNLHFDTEQRVKDYFDLPLQFNGTCGIWRKNDIVEAGGWQEDTLTEDLDLSYRAQMLGKKIIYNPAVIVPGELPSDIRSLKIQQHRWMKGGAETAKKLMIKLWRSAFSLPQKLAGSFHLLSSSIYLGVFLMSLSSVVIVLFKSQNPLGEINLWISYLPFLFFVVSILSVNLSKPTTTLTGLRQWMTAILLVPVLMAFSTGLAFHNTVAVTEGWLGKKSPFLRTPKGGAYREVGQYISSGTMVRDLPELLLGLYFTTPVVWYGSSSPFFHFHLLCAIGYISIFILSIASLYPKK